MSILSMVYDLLREADVVNSAEEFSEKWCERSPSWYANRKHENAEFTIDTAINCNLVANLYLDVRQFGSEAHLRPSSKAREAVVEVRGLTERYLERRYRVAKLVLTPFSPLLKIE